jgi:hypothetical protein
VDSLPRSAERLHAFGVHRCLHREDRDAGEARGERAAHGPIAREGAWRDTAVDQRDRHAASSGPLEEERPDLGLRQQDEPGTRCVERLLDGSRQVEREGEDRQLACEDRVGESAARRRRDRETPAPPGRSPFELSQKTPRNPHLSDGNRVDPDASVEVGIRRAAETTAHVAQTPPPEKGPHERVGGVGEERECREDAIQEHRGIMNREIGRSGYRIIEGSSGRDPEEIEGGCPPRLIR